MRSLDGLAQTATRLHLSSWTVACYQRWVKQFLLFSKIGDRWRAPGQFRGGDLGAFLTYLAVERMWRC
jgi:hypothetical protein